MKFDELIVNHVGDFGTAQKIQFFLVCLPILFTAMHALSWTFTAADVLNRCKLPDEPDNATYWIPPDDPHSNLFRRLETCAHDHNTKCPFITCQMEPGNQTCMNGYIYDHSVITYSAIQRWDIVCDRSILKAVIQIMYYIGQMLGSIVFGFLGDRIGRKKVFFIAIMLQFVSGIGMTLSAYWPLFSLFRIGVGFAHPGIFMIAVVIGMELVGPSKRKMSGVISAVFFAFGQTFLGVIAYYVRNYQNLQITIALPALIFITYWWLIPESARWLISQKRYEEADAILRKMAKRNKKILPSNWWENVEEAEISNKASDIDSKKTKVSIENRKHNFCDLFATKKIRTISFCTFFCWPVVSMIYYGMSMKSDFLGGDLYTTFIFGSLVEARF